MSEVMPGQLARSLNLRDVGGVRSKDGVEVKRGLLYRSGALAELSPAELAAIRALDIRSIVDLRYNGERALHQTPWEALGCRSYWFRDYHPSGGGDLHELLADEALTASAARALMIRAYAELPYGHVEALQHLFRTVGGGEGPFLLHCTSGKDRTGMATALILTALDVPRDTIIADYLASTSFDVLASPAFRRDKPFSPERLEALRPIYMVERGYLDAMFEAIESRDGSVEGFFHRTLALTAGDIDSVRKRLLV